VLAFRTFVHYNDSRQMNIILSYPYQLSRNNYRQLPLPLSIKSIRSLRSMHPRTCLWGTSAGRRSCEACPQESVFLSRTPCPEALFHGMNTAELSISLYQGRRVLPYQGAEAARRPRLAGGFEPELNSRLTLRRVEPQLNPYFSRRIECTPGALDPKLNRVSIFLRVSAAIPSRKAAFAKHARRSYAPPPRKHSNLIRIRRGLP
jgi:hypothetical protein